MKHLQTPLLVATLVLFLALTPSAHAVLMNQGDGTVLDTDLNIFWLQDANTAATNQFGLTQTGSNWRRVK